MISNKLANMRSRLLNLGVSNNDTEKYLNLAETDISEAVRPIVSQAIQEAASLGNTSGGEEFLSQISLDADSGYVQISTDSHNMDFSTQPFPMLPWLLKNAKVAKDGSRYKVIPVGAKSDRPDKMIKNIEEGLSALNSSKRGVSDMASEMAAAFGAGANNKIKAPSRQSSSSSTGEPSFRVASSKQDPNSQWVLPAKDLNLTSAIMEINLRIRQQVDTISDEIIDGYLREAEEWHS